MMGSERLCAVACAYRGVREADDALRRYGDDGDCGKRGIFKADSKSD